MWWWFWLNLTSLLSKQIHIFLTIYFLIKYLIFLYYFIICDIGYKKKKKKYKTQKQTSSKDRVTSEKWKKPDRQFFFF